jgi:hypothetical protein
MLGLPVYQFPRTWVDVGSFHTRLVVMFIIFTAPVRNILDKLSYNSAAHEPIAKWSLVMSELKKIEFCPHPYGAG